MRYTLLLLTCLLFSNYSIAEDLVLHADTLLAIPGRPPLNNQTVVIHGNKIVEVIDGFIDPGPDTATGLGVQMTDDELIEIVSTAHNLRVRVAAHAHGTDGINAALRAGVDARTLCPLIHGR